MIIYCTRIFYTEIHKLKKNNSYAAIIDDVCDYFKDKDINELHITRDIISSANKIYSLNKYRIVNSLLNKGKSSSYRCISGCFVQKKYIILDTIYPKTGSDGFDNLTKETYKRIEIG